MHYSTDPSYSTADAFLHTRGKAVPRKKVANNTYLERHDLPSVGGATPAKAISLVLHATHVVTYSEDGLVTLNTGGWLTVTTKERINTGLPKPWTLRSVKGVWELVEGYGLNVRTVTRYTDGISLRHYYQMDPHTSYDDTYGYALVEATCLPHDQREADDRHNKAMAKLIGRYLKAYTGQEVIDSCNLCRGTWAMNPASKREVLTSYGDALGDTQHLIDHMLDGDYPGSLIQAAVTQAGYLGDIGHGKDTVKRTLRSYLGNRLYRGAQAPANGKKPVGV